MLQVKRKIAAILLIIIFLTLITCSKNESGVSPVITDNEKLEPAFYNARILFNEYGNLKCLVVADNENVIREQYFGTGGANTESDVRSVTKSVIGILIGIAIDKGFIESVEKPIGGYLSSLVPSMSADKYNIKIKDLLTMSSGFEWNETNTSVGYNEWVTSPNQVQHVFNKNLIRQPGSYFDYNSGALHLLSVILTEATKMNTLQFATEYLFKPLDIGTRNWLVDKQAYYNGGAGLKITPMDMVKMGRLILNKGTYKGKRVVSENWINQILNSKISTNNTNYYGPGYSYCWWTGQNNTGSYIFANGYGGQFIFIVPSKNLVIVTQNNWSGISTNITSSQWIRTIEIITNDVMPVFN